MDEIDSILMSVYKMGSSMEELSRSLNDTYTKVEKLGSIFKVFFEANQKAILTLDKRVSRLEGKLKACSQD
jgi:hypothetical protein